MERTFWRHAVWPEKYDEEVIIPRFVKLRQSEFESDSNRNEEGTVKNKDDKKNFF